MRVEATLNGQTARWLHIALVMQRRSTCILHSITPRSTYLEEGAILNGGHRGVLALAPIIWLGRERQGAWRSPDPQWKVL